MLAPLAGIEGKYEIVAKIREGGMGAIYRVRHRLLDEIRVVKTLKAQHDGDEELRARFTREAKAAIRLRHPNVVQIFDFGVDESGSGLIVMEFIRGVDLQRLIETQAPPSLPLALELARQSLRALGFLHRHGYVHRDVSPDNLMLTLDVDEQPLVKLIDLGIAKRVDSQQNLTVSGSFLGKFRYASPEHFGASGGTVDARSDLYTFGLVLYELITGVYPIESESTSQLIAAHLFQEPIPFSVSDPEGRIPPAVRDMLSRALAKKPDDRWQSADEWQRAIRGIQRQNEEIDDDVLSHEARGLIDASPAPNQQVQPPAGSTQRRLDRNFGRETTPLPQHLVVAPAPATPPVPIPQAPIEGSVPEPSNATPAPPPTPAPARNPTPPSTPVADAAGPSLAEAIERHLEESRRRAADGRYTAALESLQEAQALAPDDAALREQLGQAILQLHRDIRAHEKARQVDEVRTRIAELLDAERLEEAEAALDRAVARAGAAEPFATERHRLEELRAERVEALVTEAGRAFDTERFSTAASFLEQVLEVDPDNRWVRKQLARARQKAEEAEQQLRQAEAERLHELEQYDRELEAGAFDLAARRLERYAERFGDDAAAPLRERFDARRATTTRELLRSAQEAGEQQDFIKARLLAEHARDLSPNDTAVFHFSLLLDEAVSQEHPNSQPLNVDGEPPNLLLAVGQIEKLRVDGEPLRAWRAVQQAIGTFGEIETLIELRRNLAERILDDAHSDEAEAAG